MLSCDYKYINTFQRKTVIPRNTSVSKRAVVEDEPEEDLHEQPEPQHQYDLQKVNYV